MRSARSPPARDEIEQDLAERGLGRLLLARRRRDRRHLDLVPRPLALLAGDAAALDQRLARLRRIAAEPGPGLPFLALGDAHPLAQRGDLAGIHQPGMIVLVAGEGQAEALDRVGDEQGRHVVLRGVERLDQRLHVVAAEIGHQRGERLVVAAVEQRLHRRRVLQQPLAPGGAAEIGERRIIGVADRLDPGLELGAARLGEGGFELLAIFERDDAPAAAREDLVEAAEHAVGGRRVERLAVIVDDPPAIADVVLVGLDQAFVDIALVELGIAHQGDHPARARPARIMPCAIR